MNWRRKLLFLQIESGGFGWSVQWLFLDKQKGFYLGCAIHLVTGVDVFVPAVEYQVKHLCSLHCSLSSTQVCIKMLVSMIRDFIDISLESQVFID